MKKPSFLLISLDTVRADVAYSGKFQALNLLRTEGVSFAKVVSCSPLTPVSHASILSGLYPYHHGIRHLFRERLGDHIVTLAQYLRQAGYRTAGIVSCPGMNRWYGFDRGFDHYDDDIPLLPDGTNPLLSTDVAHRGLAAKRGAAVVDRALEWLQKNSRQPLFLFLHFFDAHVPYSPPEPFASEYANNLYEGEVAYMDHQLLRLHDEFKRLGIADQFVWIVTADHGEDLEGLYENDHGGEKHGNPQERGHGCLLYGSTQYVPLLFYHLPIEISVKEINAQVRSVDIMPTLLELAGIPPLQPLDGVSLLPYFQEEERDLPGYSETFYPEEYRGPEPPTKSLKPLQSIRLVVAGRDISIIWTRGGDEIEVFDQSSDPNERKSIF
ncbi:MAG: sulfatase [bacterium]